MGLRNFVMKDFLIKSGSSKGSISNNSLFVIVWLYFRWGSSFAAQREQWTHHWGTFLKCLFYIFIFIFLLHCTFELVRLGWARDVYLSHQWICYKQPINFFVFVAGKCNTKVFLFVSFKWYLDTCFSATSGCN